ncbi:hypothetical protein D1AOALGA4SA_5019 [Olavius algarvensis Delta 1 endosymbiont]|nr:hypothetical protein D1AOALGA4SA_5019 [Olavius algarvensis Delta 1 endosymbiont]
MGCAHQIALNSIVKGGHSPPYNTWRLMDSGSSRVKLP